MGNERPIRVLIAKPGLDGHDVGAKVIVQKLRDSGMEVIYTGLRQTPSQIVSAALQEDVDVLGLSILSGSHLELTQEVMAQLRAKGITDLLVLVGGIIPKADIARLKEEGVDGVFPVHSTLEEIERFIREGVPRKRKEIPPKRQGD